ncbi:MAG: hypothetical protein FWE33_01595 [Defluviitaleaceae bacterium]|nr:hypothetical protein [Defluviitaleaceae bacterium]
MYANEKFDTNTLSISQKITALRKDKKISQDKIAEVALTSQAQISRIETSTSAEEYNQDELERVKKFLKIEGMPLTEDERAAFRESLYYWRDLLRVGRTKEAEDMHKVLSPAVNLEPVDTDLSMLYRLFEVIHIFYEAGDNYADIANEKMSYLEDKQEIMSVEHLYYYHSNIGFIKILNEQYTEAIKSFTKTLDLVKDNEDFSSEDLEKVHYHIALCYNYIENPFRTIMFLNKIPRANSGSRTSLHRINSDVMLSLNYIKIGEFDFAKELLNNCLLRAKGTLNKSLIGLVLRNLGVLYRFSKDWEKSIDYFDQAMMFLEETSEHYMGALYYKARCLIELKSFTEAKKIIINAKAKYSKSPDLIIFEILTHILAVSKRMSSYDVMSVEYIEKTAIKYFIDNSIRLEAIACCELLSEYGVKSKRTGKSLEAKAIINDIYKHMFNNQKGGNVL